MAYGFNDDKSKFDIEGMGDAYSLPFTYNDTDITITNIADVPTTLIILPWQKELFLTVYLRNETESEILPATKIREKNPILCDLPILTGVSKNFTYYFPAVMTVENVHKPTLLTFKNSDDNHGVTVDGDVNQSVLYLFDSFPAGASIFAQIRIPYHDLTVEHPFSEATLLGDPNSL